MEAVGARLEVGIDVFGGLIFIYKQFDKDFNNTFQQHRRHGTHHTHCARP